MFFDGYLDNCTYVFCEHDLKVIFKRNDTAPHTAIRLVNQLLDNLVTVLDKFGRSNSSKLTDLQISFS